MKKLFKQFLQDDAVISTGIATNTAGTSGETSQGKIPKTLKFDKWINDNKNDK